MDTPRKHHDDYTLEDIQQEVEYVRQILRKNHKELGQNNLLISDLLNEVHPGVALEVMNYHNRTTNPNAYRAPFEERQDRPFEDVDPIEQSIHDQFATEKEIVKLNERMGTLEAHRKLEEEKANRPLSIRDALENAVLDQ